MPPAAKKGDMVQATDTHIVILGPPPGPTPLPHPYMGQIDNQLSSDVNIDGQPAATVNSTATNTPSHVPQGGSFQKPPSNLATIKLGSMTVMINGKGAARHGDIAETCNDPADLPIGQVLVPFSTVNIGG